MKSARMRRSGMKSPRMRRFGKRPGMSGLTCMHAWLMFSIVLLRKKDWPEDDEEAGVSHAKAKDLNSWCRFVYMAVRLMPPGNN